MAKYYKSNNINEHFAKIYQRRNTIGIPVNYNEYIRPENPFSNLRNPQNGDIFYAKKWGCLIIDEGHNYFNISTVRCNALCAISAQHRWVL